jgi:hypothetical protein
VDVVDLRATRPVTHSTSRPGPAGSGLAACRLTWLSSGWWREAPMMSLRSVLGNAPPLSGSPRAGLNSYRAPVLTYVKVDVRLHRCAASS